MPNRVQAAGEAMPKTVKCPKLNKELSFVALNTPKGNGYNYWSNVPAGQSYALDCAIGVRLAEELITFMRQYPVFGNAALLGPIAIAMDENGATRGHKIGFFNTINKVAMVGAFAENLRSAL